MPRRPGVPDRQHARAVRFLLDLVASGDGPMRVRDHFISELIAYN